MSFSGVPTGGFGPSSGFRFSGFRHGQLDGRNNSFRYPSPWWDVAHMSMPSNIRQLFRDCLYHMLANPLVSSVAGKMAAYPITDVVVEEDDIEGFDKHKNRWEDLLFRTLDIQRTMLEAGLNYYGYGNSIYSIRYPFWKYLKCPICGYEQKIEKLQFRRQWDVRGFNYHLSCPRCHNDVKARVIDRTYPSYQDIRLVRWNPRDITIDFNPLSQKTEYGYIIPGKIRAKILKKKRSYLVDTPTAFMRALRTTRPVLLRPSNVFHMKAPTPSLLNNDEGWGYPPILPALKDSFYLQIMKKAQEAVMLERLIPLDVFYPASGDQAANPYLMVNLSDWKRRIEIELGKWKWDPNYKPILPLPVGYQRIGGDGKALMLTQEIRVWAEHIVIGMGVPQEFAFGGLTWSGSSVSLRMLENIFMTYRSMLDHFLRHFLVPNISRFLHWPEVGVHMKAFKMADDIQTKQLLLSLNQLNKISDRTMLAELDKDPTEEKKLIEKELRQNLEIERLGALYRASMQGESQLVGAKFQVKGQEIMQEAQQRLQEKMQQQQMQMGGQPQAGGPQGMQQMGPPQGGVTMGQQVMQPRGADQDQGVNVIDLAEVWAKKLAGMPPEQSGPILDKMSSTNPQLKAIIQQKMAVQQSMEQQPLPEQKPPRSANAGI